MLQNSFYTISELNRDTENLTASICFNPEHEIFGGHFPQQPVVPGVCMLQIVKETMEQVVGGPLLFQRGHQLKFLKLIVPDPAQVIMINISWKKTEEVYQTQANFKNEAEVLFKLSGEFVVY